MRPSFCLECGQPLQEVTLTLYTCSNGHEYFNNPRTSTAIIFERDDGLVLFSKRAFDPGKGKYDFPGGFLDYHENPYEGAVREIHEETGLVISPADLQLVAVYDGEYTPYLSVIDIVFLCQKWTGDFVANDDSQALEWKPLSFVDSPDSNIHYPELAAKLQKARKVLS